MRLDSNFKWKILKNRYLPLIYGIVSLCHHINPLNVDFMKKFLNEKMTDFIYASINRVSVTGDLFHQYRITVNEIKTATGLQRLHESSVTDYLSAYFNVNAYLNGGAGVFNVEVDLTKCTLDGGQARMLSAAMEVFRAERT